MKKFSILNLVLLAIASILSFDYVRANVIQTSLFGTINRTYDTTGSVQAEFEYMEGEKPSPIYGYRISPKPTQEGKEPEYVASLILNDKTEVPLANQISFTPRMPGKTKDSDFQLSTSADGEIILFDRKIIVDVLDKECKERCSNHCIRVLDLIAPHYNERSKKIESDLLLMMNAFKGYDKNIRRSLVVAYYEDQRLDHDLFSYVALRKAKFSADHTYYGLIFMENAIIKDWGIYLVILQMGCDLFQNPVESSGARCALISLDVAAWDSLAKRASSALRERRPMLVSLINKYYIDMVEAQSPNIIPNLRAMNSLLHKLQGL